MIAVLFPRFDHPAIEERYASWQAELQLRPQAAEIEFYEEDEKASGVVAGIAAEHVFVVTDPLLLTSRNLLTRLAAALGDADAIVPVTNESRHPRQQRPAPAPYMTLRELEEMMRGLEAQPPLLERVTWNDADPAAYLCRTESLRKSSATLGAALRGRSVAISSTDYVHRWSSMRGQVRQDLLDRIGTDARSVLEFGCGEAPLGAALKARQKCRVVGVELDREAAAVARKRIDDVYEGDVRNIVQILDEQFDWIIGGDIVEHLDDPWTFLADLRRLCKPGGHLLLSLPNIANASVIADLLQGRFDYVYMGLTCAGHLRFFTRRSIDELLAIAGWTPVKIEPQTIAFTPQATDLVTRLGNAGIGFNSEELLASGFYVTAQNPR